MYAQPINYEAYIRRKGLPLVNSADKSSATSIFSSDIFGYNENERMRKSALIPLHCYIMRPLVLNILKRVNRRIVQIATTQCEVYLRDGVINIKDDTYVHQNGDIEGESGPKFLYDNWDKLDKKKFEQDTGRYSNIELKKTIGKMSKEDIFENYVYVMPLKFRDEDQDTMIIVNEFNTFYAELIKYSRLLEQNVQGVKRNDIEILMQNKRLEFGEYITDRFLGPKGVARKQIYSRAVDGSSRMTFLANYYTSPKIGQTKIKMGATGLPCHHLISMFKDTILKFSTDLINIFHSKGYFPEGTTTDMLAFYDVEYMSERIKKMEDFYERVQPFPAITPDGNFIPLKIPMSITDPVTGKVETVEKELTWIEFFYIAGVGVANIYENRRATCTRFPIDSMTSMQFMKPVMLTIAPQHLRTVEVVGMTFESDFPYMTDYLRANYHEKFWEQGSRNSSAVIVRLNGDYDGDAGSFKPLNTKEAKDICDAINDSLSQIFDYTGNYLCNIGKDCNQTFWTLTRDATKKDKPKLIPSSHPFMKYLDYLKDGGLNVMMLYKYTLSTELDKEPELSLTDTVKIKFNNKDITTTLGRYIFNKVVFASTWNNKHFDFVNETMFKNTFVDTMKLLAQLVVENKCPKDAVHKAVDMSTELGLRLATVYNAGLTDSMLIPDEEFIKFRDAKINEVKDYVAKTGDLVALDKAINEIVNFAKEYYKNDEMLEMFVSKAKAKMENEFKNMNICMGGLPKLTGGNTVIFQSLSDGIPDAHTSDLVNVGMKGAIDRGFQTALAGTQNKDIINGLNSIYTYQKDCGSTKGVKMTATKRDQILNKYVLVNGKSILINLDNVQKYLNKEIEVRSLIYCKEKNGNYCSHCMGETAFLYSGRTEVASGIQASGASSKILNMFMSSTHNLVASIFVIKDLNEYIVPKLNKPLFEIKTDPITGTPRIYCLENIEWRVPASSIDPVDTTYSVLVHGSIITTDDNQDHTIVLGTEVYTKPTEIINPDQQVYNDLERHVIFKYNKGDVFIENTHSERKEMTVYKMFNMFLSGNASNLVPFETHLLTMRNTIDANRDVSMNKEDLEIILSSLARDKNDLTKPARETGNLNNYKFVSLYDLMVMGGTFSSMFGPDSSKSIIINMMKTEKEQNNYKSPQEVAVRY